MGGPLNVLRRLSVADLACSYFNSSLCNRGGALVYRCALYYPGLVTDVFSLCTPYSPPATSYVPLQVVAKAGFPDFRYQEHFASGELEAIFKSRADIKLFLSGMLGGRGGNGEVGLDSTKGVILDNIWKLEKPTYITDRELNYYAEEFFRHGLHGPLNWYRTRELNYVDEFEHFFHSGKIKDRPRIEQNVLFVFAKRDEAPPKPILMQRMEERVTNLTKREVDGGHWMMWEKAEDLNIVLQEWLEGVVFIKELSRL